MKEKLDRGY